MINVVLVEPQIPPNTGNIIRLAANTGCQVHLVKPMAFHLDDKRLRRAGLDYDEWAEIHVHESWAAFIDQENPQRLFAISTKGRQGFSEVSFAEQDYLIFGSETKGLADHILFDNRIRGILRIPMLPHSRSMNLSNAVSVLVYEAWRQQGFVGSV